MSKVVNRTAIVPFSASQMFHLVNDVEQYPLFLPWCRGVQVISKTKDEIHATVQIAKGGLGKSFTTANRLIPHEKIEMRLIQGPFKYLHGAWQFKALSEQTSEITLSLSFEFLNQILSFTLGPMFHHITSTMVDAFTQRAHDIYANTSVV